MSDSINGLGKPVGPPTSRAQGAPDSGSARQPSAAPAGGDLVNLTDTARQLQALARVTAGGDVVNVERVDAIRQSIADGQYAVDSRQVAERLLQFDS